MPSQLAAFVKRGRFRPILGGVAAYLFIAPCVPVLTQALTLLTAQALSSAAELTLAVLVPHLPVDPVYARALVYNLGHIDPRGLAVAGPVGTLLHQLWPHLFTTSDYVQDGAAASAVIEGAPTVAAALLARLGAAIPLLSAAMLLASSRRPPGWSVVTCLLVQAQVLIDLAPELTMARSEIEAAGIPFLVAALLPVSQNGQRAFFTRSLDSVPDWIVGALAAVILSAAALLAAYAWAAVARRAARLIAVRCLPALRSGEPLPGRSLIRRAKVVPSISALAFVLAITLTPLRAISESETVFVEQDTSAGDTNGPVPADATPATSANGASHVTLERNDDAFTLRVNGTPTVVRGVGYNPWYAQLDQQQRRDLYQRDFGQIRATGANMLEGWFEQQFDDVTLDVAQANGLGVIMPFELNQDYDYSDPAVQSRFLDQISAWVVHYRANPAVRMWAPGNEVMHRLIYPTLVRGAADPSLELRADDFATFYVKIIDRVHELDPDHPVLYRDAEDGYIGRLSAALKANPAARPWLIYGANVYTPRIEQIVRDWSTQTLDAPLIFSEFAPSGMSAQDRPRRFEWFWRVIRSRPAMVLGGVVYTWCTAGPEDLDRVFGLTDGNGQPVDGSVAALGRMFHSARPTG